MSKTINSPIIIGLTGGIGSGKTTVAKLFNKLGVESVDVDDIAREVVAPGENCLQEIVQAFGSDILTEDGSLDRAGLRQIVFADPALRKKLESITHPAIKARLKQKLASCESKIVLLVHPLLFETGQNNECKFTIAISIPKQIQIERVMRRDNNSEQQVMRIMDTQLTNQERIERADFILENTSNNADLSVKVLQLHNKLQNLLSLE
ncbi:MAG: dephospho-CoA kinase [Marinomonas sp.]|nr:MAG: dephospho-CoA kinase [Marinomonas sp.]